VAGDLLGVEVCELEPATVELVAGEVVLATAIVDEVLLGPRDASPGVKVLAAQPAAVAIFVVDEEH